MNTYKQIQPLSKTEAAYIAGLIDGEGTVTLTRKHKKENRQLCVSISSTEIDLLDFVASVAGVGKITNKQTSKSHHSHSYAYACLQQAGVSIVRANPSIFEIL
jgi:hypothetical protein